MPLSSNWLSQPIVIEFIFSYLLEKSRVLKQGKQSWTVKQILLFFLSQLTIQLITKIIDRRDGMNYCFIGVKRINMACLFWRWKVIGYLLKQLDAHVSHGSQRLPVNCTESEQWLADVFVSQVLMLTTNCKPCGLDLLHFKARNQYTLQTLPRHRESRFNRNVLFKGDMGSFV